MKMPTYLFQNVETGEEFTESMKISELDAYLEKNPNFKQLVNGAPLLCDPVRMGLRKPDDSFRDVLKHVKKSHYKSTVNVL